MRDLKNVVVVAVLCFAPGAALAQSAPTTNTNRCITDLGGIRACQDTGPLGLPNNLGACCDGVRALATDRCECNPALDLLLGEQGTQIYELEPVCRIVQPLKWLTVKPRVLRNCNGLQTHRYGCSSTDMQVDAARLGSMLGFGAILRGTDNQVMCLDTPAFIGRLGTVLDPNIAFTVPYGVGTYHGLEDVSEYVAMVFGALNHGFWQYAGLVDPSQRARLSVSANGADWTQGVTQSGTFLRGALPYTEYLEQVAHFEGCKTQVTGYDVVPTEGMRNLIELYVQTSDLSKRWGVEDICRYHTQFCAGEPETRQYASETECLAYLNSLPLYTDACGQNRPMNGHSLSCKFKHHFMIPTDPMLHCAHIGPLGASDSHGHLKCDDTTECGTDQGQNSWPPVEEIGASTPQDRVDLFQTSNVGFESEPLGCAMPVTDAMAH